jgi:hypothetical protein
MKILFRPHLNRSDRQVEQHALGAAVPPARSSHPKCRPPSVLTTLDKAPPSLPPPPLPGDVHRVIEEWDCTRGRRDWYHQARYPLATFAPASLLKTKVRWRCTRVLP